MLDVTILGYSTESLGVIQNAMEDNRNIILTKNGEMVLVDFGSARSCSADGEIDGQSPEELLEQQHDLIYLRVTEFVDVITAAEWFRKAMVESKTHPDEWGGLGEGWRDFLKELPFEEWERDERDRLGLPQIGPYPDSEPDDTKA